MPQRHILVTLSPCNGFDYHGPFDSQEAAERYAQDHCREASGCWVEPLPEYSSQDWAELSTKGGQA